MHYHNTQHFIGFEGIWESFSEKVRVPGATSDNRTKKKLPATGAKDAEIACSKNKYYLLQDQTHF